MLEFLTALALFQAAATQSAPAPQPPACASEEHASFDFWLGEWDVSPNGSDKKTAKSRIERVSSGCVIREHWMPISGRDGVSMTFLNPATNRWEQVWVGSDGNRVDFHGGMVDGKMVLTGYWRGSGSNGEDVLTRMTYSQREDGSVRQFGEGSTDHGVSWQTSFDLIYTPKETE
ncbi:hypothetical protein [Altererythrobacter sp. GH1-8]|uniref:hypothetical protein n=1 Tax=Altererythrobacter sp. GH1-8 TaxID=3349333 RepID=UPI00374D7199